MLLNRLRECFPRNVRETFLADHGFGERKLCTLFASIEFDYVIRIRSCIQVTSAKGEWKSTAE